MPKQPVITEAQFHELLLDSWLMELRILTLLKKQGENSPERTQTRATRQPWGLPKGALDTEIRREGGVGPDPFHPGGRQKDELRPFPVKIVGHCGLAPRIQFMQVATHQVTKAGHTQAPPDSATHQALVSGHEDFGVRFQPAPRPPPG